jgi:preprotein translocase subunit SecA
MEWRQAILHGRETPGIWERAALRRDVLVGALGIDAIQRAERTVTLHCIDRAWRDHLALVADVREGIHLVSLGGRDALTHFTLQVTQAFDRLEESIDEAVLEAIEHVRIVGDRVDLGDLDLKGPSSTWTYLVNDDPFRDQIGRLLTGPGRVTFAIGGALFAMPLMIAWGVVDRIWRRGPRRRPNPFGR